MNAPPLPDGTVGAVMPYLLVYLAIGACFVVSCVVRGAITFEANTVTVLSAGKPPVTKTTRDVPEALVTAAIWLFGWFPMIVFLAVLYVRGELARRRHYRDTGDTPPT